MIPPHSVSFVGSGPLKLAFPSSLKDLPLACRCKDLGREALGARPTLQSEELETEHRWGSMSREPLHASVLKLIVACIV